MENKQNQIGDDRRSDLVAEKSLAVRWNKSIRTLQRMRAQSDVPPWIAIGHSIFYRFGDVLDFEQNARHVEAP